MSCIQSETVIKTKRTPTFILLLPFVFLITILVFGCATGLETPATKAEREHKELNYVLPNKGNYQPVIVDDVEVNDRKYRIFRTPYGYQQMQIFDITEDK